MANDTRSRMLEATGRLLRQRGYHGTSLNDILAASGAPRGSLYFHFPGGKDQLVIEVTRASVREVAERLARNARRGKKPRGCGPPHRRSHCRDAGKERLCAGLPGGAGGAGRNDRHSRTRRALPRGVRGVDRPAAEIVYDAGIPDKRARSLALLVEASIEGMMVIARATRDYRPMLDVADELATLLEAAVPATAESGS